jgi:1-acyl-sn-glycerol-3-phosphate acyltransferase
VRRLADRFVQALVRLVLAVFFREVEVVGEEKVQPGRPLLLVANHVNALVDPLLIFGPLPVYPRFLAKSTLWGIAFLRPFLALAGVIPVYRRQDEPEGGAAPVTPASRNEETFARCHEVLAAGGAIAIFPEGTSHNQPALQPLKTGAARIVLEAERKHPGLGTRIVPVGLVFDRKGKFRSRALVQVGEPLDPADDLPLYQEDGPAAVRRLTARIDEGLKAVTLNYPSWEEARLIARAADLWARPALDVPRARKLEETAGLTRALLAGYRDLQNRYPDRVAALAQAVRGYDRLLEACRLTDEQVASAYPPSPVLRFVSRSLLRLLLHLPLAIVGTVLNYVPYRLIGLIASRAAAKSPDLEATFKVFGALLLYPLAWLLEALLVGWNRGPWLGLLTFAAAPATGWAALLFHERRKYFWKEARAYLLLRTRRGVREELKARRGEVYGALEALAEEWRSGSSPRA